jgi:hypothetical protein
MPAKRDYSKFRADAPRSILVVPAINRSVDVDAPNYYLSTIARPLAERGYYVYPVNLVKRMMEDDGLADSGLVHSADARRLGELFSADAVLYVTIERWDARYVVLSTTVTVEFSYVLKSAKTNDVLWDGKQSLVYSPQNNSSGGVAGLIVAAINAAIVKAAPNYMPLTRQANALVVYSPGRGLPAGPYDALYDKDREQF